MFFPFSAFSSLSNILKHTNLKQKNTNQLSSCFSMAASVSTIKHQMLNQEPTKFYNHFLYKSLIISILIILPFFPSQPPEFINHSILTRNWELLHILLVGFAISYGLFCRFNSGTHKDNNNNNKFDTAQSYVSKFLQVFEDDEDDDETETPSRKIKTLNNHHEYHRKEPFVLLAPEHTNNNTRISEKPLLLPVRSLKSKLSEPSCPAQSLNESNPTSVFVNTRFSSDAEKGDNVVLASPVPWRSESLMKIQTSRLPRSNIMPSPTSMSPRKKKGQSLSSEESVAKNSEDVVKNKGFYKSSSIPMPPPPPPPMLYKSISMKPRPSSLSQSVSLSEKDMMNRNFTSERKHSYVRSPLEGEEDQDKRILGSFGFDEDTESEDEGGGGGGIVKDKVENEVKNDEEKSKTEGGIGEEGPDVDKKADEFIAKFREQIRLQRIDSIKRSASRMARNSSR